MSTRFDILDARKRRDSHFCTSECGRPCPVRIALSSEHLQVAARWGLDYDDDTRQREQFNARVSTGSGG